MELDEPLRPSSCNLRYYMMATQRNSGSTNRDEAHPQVDANALVQADHPNLPRIAAALCGRTEEHASTPPISIAGSGLISEAGNSTGSIP